MTITKYVYTHKEFDLVTEASSAEESTDIHRNNAAEMEYNTNIRKTDN